MIPRIRRFRFRVVMFATMVASLMTPCVSHAISPVRLGGALEGRVSDDSGHPQMGAIVQLFNKQDKLVERKLTDEEGLFVFPGLLPDIYSVRVTLATFLPAIKSQIDIRAGRSSLLDINLSGLFSSIHLLPPVSRSSGVLNDDWKWILRSSSSTRPIFRYAPQPVPAVVVSSGTSSQGTSTPIFSGSRGLVQFSAGDGSDGGPSGELGTAFAFATSLLGTNELQFAGDVGYGASSDSPSAAFRTVYSRGSESAIPEISVTMRQIYVPRWAGSTPEIDHPPLRTVAVGLRQRTEIDDGVELEYGAQLDSVSFGDHVHYFSPYARLTWALGTAADGRHGGAGTIDVTYTSGNARPELGRDNNVVLDEDRELQRDVAALASAPPVTLRAGRAKVQRGEDYEIGYSRKMGSRDFRMSAYRESVQNAALMVVGADGLGFSGDLVPDVYTDSVLFDAGNSHTMGYSAALTQHLGDLVQLTVMYGTVGVLSPRSRQLQSETGDELRGLLTSGNNGAVTAIASATVPHAGTQFVASYQTVDNRVVTTGEMYSTNPNHPDPGLNISVHQPIPAFLGLPFHMEATIDMRNMLAQGYLPLTLPDGSRLLLVHTPRSLRGGFNFRF